MKVWVGDVPLKVCVCVYTQAHVCVHTQTHTRAHSIYQPSSPRSAVRSHTLRDAREALSFHCLHAPPCTVQEGGTEPHTWKDLQPHGQWPRPAPGSFLLL